MTTCYFTFGFDHTHLINGVLYDQDCVLKVTAEDPRARMVEVFGAKWAFEYPEPPNMDHFPRGILELPPNVGPGRYDDLCTVARESAQAEGAILIILAGEKGSGFSVQGPKEVTEKLPHMLRDVAKVLETSVR